MRGSRKDFDRDINDLFHFAITYLPEGWQLDLCVTKGEISMSLTDDLYDPCDCFPEYGDHIDHWLYYINYARKAVHMEPVEWGQEEKGGE